MREPISKSKRFRIFSRDKFTCRYCGRQADVIAMTIDHVHPVSKGGTSDDENLITACEDCNSGKSNKLLGSIAPTEEDRLRLAQERNELEKSYKAARSAARSKAKIRELILGFWCECTGRKEMDRQTLNVVAAYSELYGFEIVCRWISKAASATGAYSDRKMGRYVSGCRRQHLEKNPA